MDSKSSNDATDEHEGSIFGEYPNDEEVSSQQEQVEKYSERKRKRDKSMGASDG